MGYGTPPTVQQKHTCEKMKGKVVTQIGTLSLKTPVCKVGSKVYSSSTGKEATAGYRLLSSCPAVGGVLAKDNVGTFQCRIKGKLYTSDVLDAWYKDTLEGLVEVDLYKLTGTKPPALVASYFLLS